MSSVAEPQEGSTRWEKPSMMHDDDESEGISRDGSASTDEAQHECARSGRGVTLVFEELSLVDKNGGYILKDLYGMVKAGRVTGLLGAEGRGPEHLMKCLGGFTSATEGQIFANGLPIEASLYRKCVGYVSKLNLDRESLTVTQNLMFFYVMQTRQPSASARESIRYAQVENPEADDIKCPNCSKPTSALRMCRGCGCLLEGWRLAANCIGLAEWGNKLLCECPEEVRKRVSIASVLLHLPKVLFLETPTVNLDLSAGLCLVKYLKSLSKERGMAVVVTLGQPRRPLFELLDTVIMLDEGQIAYSGRTSEVLPYFISQGHDVDEHDCPSDYFLDIISSKEARRQKEEKEQRRSPLHAGGNRSSRGSSPVGRLSDVEAREQGVSHDFTLIDHEDAEDTGGNEASILVQTYKKSRHFCTLRGSILEHYKEAFANLTPGITQRNPPNSLTRLKYLLYFKYVGMVNDLGQALAKVLLIVVLAVVAGLADSESEGEEPTSEDAQLQNRVGMYFFILSATMLGNLNSASEFVARRSLLQHEVSAGYYKTKEYITAHVLFDVVLVRGALTVFFAAVMYMLTLTGIGSLDKGTSAFGTLVLCMTMTQLPFSMLSLLVGAAAKNTVVAQTLMIGIFVTFVAFGGLFLNLASLPIPLNIVQYVSVLRFSYESLLIGKLKGTPEGEAYLKHQGFDDNSREWFNMYILAAFSALYLVLTAIALWYRKGSLRS